MDQALNQKIDAYIAENKEQLLQDIAALVAIDSVEGTPEEGAPFGAGPRAALDKTLELAAGMGFATRNCENYIGYAELAGADPEKYLATICHVDVVPAGPGWNTDPFAMERREGWLLGRGVIDDKGPAVLSLYAGAYLLKHGITPRYTFRALLGIALPSGTEALSYNVSQTFILRFINLMGAAVVSAKVYGSMLANVAYVYSIAVGQATQIILGYMIGGRKLDEVSGRVWSTIRIALAASELLTLLILIFCDPIYSIFTDDPVIHALGRQILYVEFGLEIGRSINIVMTRCLTTAGDVWYPVGVGIFSMWVVAVGGSWLLGHALNWGLVGIWIAMACDECLRGALFTIRFRSGKWKETRLVSDSTKRT